MITAAALLVLVALGLFAWGIASGLTALYWACVAVSAVAAVLLVVARMRLRQVPVQGDGPAAPVQRTEPVAPPSRSGTAEPSVAPADRSGGGHTPAGAYAPAATGSEVAPTVDDVPTGTADLPSSSSGAAAAASAGPPPHGGLHGNEVEDPPVEEVEVTDLLLVVDLTDEVVVVDEHPRYHLADCRWLAGRTAIPLPLDEARTDGFTPCAICAPDHHLAQVERARRARRGAS